MNKLISHARWCEEQAHLAALEGDKNGDPVARACHYAASVAFDQAARNARKENER